MWQEQTWQPANANYVGDFSEYQRQAAKQEHLFFDSLNKREQKFIKLIANVPLPFFESERTPSETAYDGDLNENDRQIQIGQTDALAEQDAKQELRQNKLSQAHARPL